MSSLPLFGMLILDRDPLALSHFWGLFQAWLQDAGGFAFAGLCLYFLYVLLGPRAMAGMAAGTAVGVATGSGRLSNLTAGAVGRDDESLASRSERNPVTGWMLAMFVIAILCYSALGFMVLTGKGVDTTPVKQYTSVGYFKHEPPKFSTAGQPVVLMLAGAAALLGIGQPFAAGLAKVRFRRVWALSQLGFKEAVRSQLFWVFLLFLVPFLFPTKWFSPPKPEDELRNTIGVTSLTSMVLLLFPAGLLAAFSIPNDIKSQNIYTIVTKPVERFEIVLGRFVGYVLLMTLALLGMTAVGWVFILASNLDEKAAAETYMARMPVNGQLTFMSRRGRVEGTNVGREFDYRRYLGGHPQTSQRAVWSFDRVPSGLARGRDAVPLEFSFDIFRMTKGQENRGVDVDIQVVTHNVEFVPPTEPGTGEWEWGNPDQKVNYTKAAVEKLGLGRDPRVQEWAANNNWNEVYRRVRDRVRAAAPGSPDWKAVSELAGEFGFFEVAGKEVFDYHPDKVYVPAGLFANANNGDPGKAPDNTPLPRLRVLVKCTTPGQMLGMAEPDLYFLENDPVPSGLMFGQNYFKAAVGLWCRVCLVIGLAVTLSTYLAGVISFLTAGALFLAGYFADHLADMASGRSFVGGPFQSMTQLLEAKPPTQRLDESNPLARVAMGGDQMFAWLVRRFINVVPDVEAFSWTPFLSEGFNVPVEYLVMNVLVLAGYLLPWFMLGFYLMRSREVAA